MITEVKKKLNSVLESDINLFTGYRMVRIENILLQETHSLGLNQQKCKNNAKRQD